MPQIRVAIHGAAGRMGQRLIHLGGDDPDLRIAAALDAPQHPDLGKDVGLLATGNPLGVPLSSKLTPDVDVVIDFSVPRATQALVRACVEQKIPLVVATTGLSDEQKLALREAANTIPLVWSPSMSLAVNIAMKLVALAGTALRDCPGGADVEIIERHHRFKEDAPSGTALRFGEIVAQVMGQTIHRHGREGRTGQRPAGEIGYHALRVGDNPGEHTIVFGMLGETLELTVRASNRDCYAYGALLAAKFIVGRSPGLYNMHDVLGLGE